MWNDLDASADMLELGPAHAVVRTQFVLHVGCGCDALCFRAVCVCVCQCAGVRAPWFAVVSARSRAQLRTAWDLVAALLHHGAPRSDGRRADRQLEQEGVGDSQQHVAKAHPMRHEEPPTSLRRLVGQIVSMGYNENTILEKGQVVRSFQAAAVEMRKKRKIEEDTAAGQPPETHDDCMAGIPWDMIPKKDSMLSDIPVTVLRDKLLSSLETALSSSNLRAMKGPDAASKSGLLRIFEFSTGLSPDTELHTRPAFSCYNRLAEISKKFALARGRRALFLTLPPDWESAGLFELRGYSKDNPKTFEVAHRFADIVCSIAVDGAPAHNDITDLAIHCNWSETRACIQNTKTPSGTGLLLAPFSPRQNEVIHTADDSAQHRPADSRAKFLKHVSKSALVATSPGVKIQPQLEGGGPAAAAKQEMSENCDAPNGLGQSAGAPPTIKPEGQGAGQVSFDESLMAAPVP